ncbi:hypothetical protein DM82_1345 [Burkholderia oklahomensis]|uniref:Uncharacterized protein n=1 Tax=Burkholderia oklahomensis TaxID=342113 RepID=A0AAI8B771_9BURK|nr:hypothetical protein DM82_1345 [Burkholderia oklahomensis]
MRPAWRWRSTGSREEARKTQRHGHAGEAANGWTEFDERGRAPTSARQAGRGEGAKRGETCEAKVGGQRRPPYSSAEVAIVFNTESTSAS